MWGRLRGGEGSGWDRLRCRVGSGVGGLRSMWVWIQAEHHGSTWAAGSAPLACEMPASVSQMVEGSYTISIKNGSRWPHLSDAQYWLGGH